MEKNKYSETEESFVQKIFSCCFEKNSKETQIEGEEINRELNFLGISKMVFENELSLFPSNMINPEEKDKIKFTKIGILEYITNMQDLVFPLLFEENGIKISKRNYTEINGNLPLYRFEITKHKSFFTQVPSIDSMLNAMTNPELRKKWDKNMKEYKIVEKLKKNADIIRVVTSKQLAILPPLVLLLHVFGPLFPPFEFLFLLI